MRDVFRLWQSQLGLALPPLWGWKIFESQGFYKYVGPLDLLLLV